MNKLFSGKIAGCVDKRDYVVINLDGKAYKAHRLIYLLVTGIDPEQIDHINGICNDNRWCNLRQASVVKINKIEKGA